MIIYSNPSFPRKIEEDQRDYKREMVLVCHQNRDGSTRVITNKRGATPLLFLRVTISVVRASVALDGT
jgi:hypothetical protein